MTLFLRSHHRGAALVQTLLSVIVLLLGLIAGVLILRSGGKAPAGEAHASAAGEHEHQGEGDAHAAKGRVELSPEKLRHTRLGIEEAGPGKIHVVLRVFGKVVPNEEALAHVSPRFAGIARKVNKRLGDRVNAGEVLATIESNESLRGYDLQAPLGGTIIERAVTVGEFVGTDKSLFTVAELGTVWVDFQVYQQDFPRLRTGQSVRIIPGVRLPVLGSVDTPAPLPDKGGTTPGSDALARGEAVSRIDYLSPFGTESTQTMLARAQVPNADGAFRPGWFVSGEIAVEEVDAPVTVREEAVQTLDGREVVFVREGDAFEARAVRIGRRDGVQAEVLVGLQPGEHYATDNSFLLKAEIGKEGAEHED